MIKYNIWTEMALTEPAAGRYCCLQCNDANDFIIGQIYSNAFLEI
jgi:hypothetical protein